MNRLAIILAALLCMASRHPDRMIRADLALNVSFNRGDASDRSMYNHTPTLNNGAVVTAGNRYLTVDPAAPSDFVSYPDSDAFSFTDGSGTDRPFSAAAWVYLNTNTSGNRNIIYKATASPLAVEWAIRTSNGAPNLPSIILFNGGGVSAYIGRTSATPLSTGQWYHICGVYSGGETSLSCKLFINGVQSDTGPLGSGGYTGMSNTAAKLCVGGVDGTEGIDGRVDDVRIYNRELSAAEVAAIYSSGRE
jgi:hypothetical protein